MNKWKSKIKLNCNDCKNEFEINYKSFMAKSKDHIWRCKKCLNEYFKITSSNYQNSLSNEQRLVVSKKQSNGNKLYWKSLPKNIRKDRIIKCIKNVTDYRNNLTEEEKINLSKRTAKWSKEYWDNLTEEERYIQSKIRSDNFNKNRENITNMARKRSNDYWNNMTTEEFNEWNLKRSVGLASSMLKPKATEIEFMNMVMISNVEYQYRYYNKIKHQDFDKLFPINPITNSRTNPYHQWDFIIHTKNKSILVDIDGSIHDITKTNKSFVTDRNKRSLKLSDIIQFNDSKRPYQTDGLDAYAIMAYNDKINKDSPVLCIKTGEIINYTQLIAIIDLLNISKKELKKIIKEGI